MLKSPYERPQYFTRACFGFLSQSIRTSSLLAMTLSKIFFATVVLAVAAVVCGSPAELTAVEHARIMCTKEDPTCPTGTVCAGAKPGKMRCVKPMPQGGFCKGDPFWVCDEGLECIDKICTKLATKGETCVPPATKCTDGTVCAGGKPDNKRCVKPMPPGGFCKGDPFWVCEEGVECIDKICGIPVTKGESCVPPNTVCVDGTVCAGGKPDNKRCVKPMPVGSPCKGDPFWVCEEGLVCKRGKCRRKKIIATKGESCVPKNVRCERGTLCAGGKPDNKRCVKPLEEGDVCKGDPFWVCNPKKGLECIRQMCVKV